MGHNYVKVNRKTKKGYAPLNLFDKLYGFIDFSKLDALHDYWQITLATAQINDFLIFLVLVEYFVMATGMTIKLSHSQMTMDQFFQIQFSIRGNNLVLSDRARLSLLIRGR